MNNGLRDPFEKVSNSLRRAVSVNKSRECDLRSTVNTIQRERRRSFNSWSMKQEKFLRAKLKLMPAIRQEKRENTSRIRRFTMAKGTSPVTMADTRARPNSPAVQHTSQMFTEPQTERNQAYTLPPVILGREKVRSISEMRPQGLFLPTSNTIHKLSDNVQDVLKSRRRTEYRCPRQPNAEEPQGEGLMLRQRLSRVELRNSSGLGSTLTSKRIVYSQGNAVGMPGIKEENENSSVQNDEQVVGENVNSGRKTCPLKRHLSKTSNKGVTTESSEAKNEISSLLPSICSVLPNEEEQGNKLARSGWRKVRESLTVITGRQKRKDITQMSMLELNKLFEEIRECRYLRVGNHTSYMGDSVDTRQCKCIACTVVDKTKLRNNLSAPE